MTKLRSIETPGFSRGRMSTKSKPGQMRVLYREGTKRRKADFWYTYGEGVPSTDANLISLYLFGPLAPSSGGLLQELAARGYDPRTLQFSIQKGPVQMEMVKSEPQPE